MDIFFIRNTLLSPPHLAPPLHAYASAPPTLTRAAFFAVWEPRPPKEQVYARYDLPLGGHVATLRYIGATRNYQYRRGRHVENAAASGRAVSVGFAVLRKHQLPACPAAARALVRVC